MTSSLFCVKSTSMRVFMSNVSSAIQSFACKLGNSEEDHGGGSFRGRKVGDGLRHAIIKDAEVFFLETGDDVAVLRGGDNVEGDDGNVDCNSDASLRRLLRRTGCCRRSRVLLLRRGTALGAGGGLGKDGILGQRQDQTGRENCEQNYGKNGLHHVSL